MKTYELKEAIAAKVVEIKALKKQLRQDHRTLNGRTSGLMVDLWRKRCEIRAMYLVYGWFRGKRANQVETKPIEWWQLSYHAGKVLGDDKEKAALFKEWMVSTS